MADAAEVARYQESISGLQQQLADSKSAQRELQAKLNLATGGEGEEDGRLPGGSGCPQSLPATTYMFLCRGAQVTVATPTPERYFASQSASAALISERIAVGAVNITDT